MTIKTQEIYSFYIYGIDARDGKVTDLSYDNAVSDHPANWGGLLTKAHRYTSYQDAWNRMQALYKSVRGRGMDALVGVSFGIITTKDTFKFNEKTADERMAELLGKFNVPNGNSGERS